MKCLLCNQSISPEMGYYFQPKGPLCVGCNGLHREGFNFFQHAIWSEWRQECRKRFGFRKKDDQQLQ